MKIREDLINKNNRIEIISNGGKPLTVPDNWKPLLSSGCSGIVVIPDMHMYKYGEPMDNFGFGREALKSLLDYLSDLKDSLGSQNKVLKIFQLGDMYELQFPGVDGNALCGEIANSNNDYSYIINSFKDLNAVKIYGNHDFVNCNFDGYLYYALEGKVHLEHGFAGDGFSANPKNPLWDPTMFVFREINEIKGFFANLAKSLNLLGKDHFFSPGVDSGAAPKKDITTREQYESANGDIKNYYCERLKNNKNGSDIKITIIGHTHQPYIDTQIEDGKYYYIDAGGWTVGRTDFAVVTDEEIAICRYKRLEEIKNAIS